ncbi:CAP domain-containing protein [Actinomyces marmotae]|uniref:CAP domain-containing protein n=1 Tax=Actinomyces marmotae TaxID=2737173 RepID=A0A6M8B270_9ACTO|nr:CAP domain-containing protein [Actinomyces marmotae]QKD80448.1 CAP domain-containing protein [Actinomyces marmotae]
MKIARLFAAAAVTASLVGITPQAVAAQAPASPVNPGAAGVLLPAATSADSAAAQQILTRVNELRQSSGLKPLTRLVELDNVSQEWSGQMAAEGNLYHRPNLRNAFPSGWTWVAENIAMNGKGLSGVELGNALFQQWVDSPGHYQNMVDRNATAIGIGIAESADGSIYATQNFAAYPDDVQAGFKVSGGGSASSPSTTPNGSGAPSGGASAEAVQPAPEVSPTADATAAPDATAAAAPTAAASASARATATAAPVAVPSSGATAPIGAPSTASEVVAAPAEPVSTPRSTQERVLGKLGMTGANATLVLFAIITLGAGGVVLILRRGLRD